MPARRTDDGGPGLPRRRAVRWGQSPTAQETAMRRHATLATVCRSPGLALTAPDAARKVVAEAETYLVRAHRMGADLVAFTEVYPQLATPNLFHHPEPAEG